MLMTCGGLLPFLCALLLMINWMMERHLSSKLRLEVFSLKIFFSRWEPDCIMPFSCWNKSLPTKNLCTLNTSSQRRQQSWQHCSFRCVLTVFITCFCGTRNCLQTGIEHCQPQNFFPICWLLCLIICILWWQRFQSLLLVRKFRHLQRGKDMMHTSLCIYCYFMSQTAVFWNTTFGPVLRADSHAFMLQIMSK